MKIFEIEMMTKWEFDDCVVYTFEHKRHMYEFMLYRDWDSFGLSKLFTGSQTYEVMILR